ncbi:unnamed protein product, partial [Mesorhabditis belari]|uniref:EGF-like domain-containing protein n=1 Tax=Mesorhabditis belari TaxID=2138241 RepID=A0AAF3EE11_9BILA
MINNYVCLCYPGLSGNYCNETDTTSGDPCSSSPCQIRPPQSPFFNCSCQPGTSGQLCEIKSTVEQEVQSREGQDDGVGDDDDGLKVCDQFAIAIQECGMPLGPGRKPITASDHFATLPYSRSIIGNCARYVFYYETVSNRDQKGISFNDSSNEKIKNLLLPKSL